MADNAQDYSDKTLEESLTDALFLLDAIGAVPEIHDALYAAGMTDEDVSEGSSLLLAVLAQPEGTRPVVDDEPARNQRAAVAALDSWDEPNFQRFKAALARRFPAAGEYIFRDLSASRGVESVKGVATFLARVDHLDNGTDPDRKESKKEDKKAVALLAKRGLTPDERTRLTELVKVALGPTGAAVTSRPRVDPAQRKARLLALKLWHNEWSATGRAVIHKRSYLIRMGLASRRVAKREKAEKPAE